jgi:hypothetical protein
MVVSASMIVTQTELAGLLAEWERRRRENPVAFVTEAEKEQLTPDQYGAAAAVYVFELRQELLSSQEIR